MVEQTGKYLGFSRKWRPQQFEDVVGQEHATRGIQNSIKMNRIFSAYLLCGPRGIGKTTTARIIAKALNCEHGPTPNPCGVCDQCRAITGGSSMDVLEIDGASNTSVDSIRELRENVNYSPYSAKYKVYIIDEVHMLSQSAFNALLKTLEEPPPFVVFIFATTEPHKIPETIISRCQVFYLNRISTEDIINRLAYIIEQEKIDIDPAQKDTILGIIAMTSEGGMRDAQVLLDQLVSLGDGEITLENLKRFLGLIDNQIMVNTLKMILTHDSNGLLNMVNELVNKGKSIEYFVKHFIKFIRDLLILKAGGDKSLVEIKGTFLENLIKEVGDVPYAAIINILNNFFELEEKLKGVVQSRFLLEFVLIKLSVIEPIESLDNLLSKIELLEKNIAGGVGIQMPQSQAQSYQPQTKKRDEPLMRESSVDTYSKPYEEPLNQPIPQQSSPSQESEPDPNITKIEPTEANINAIWRSLCSYLDLKSKPTLSNLMNFIPVSIIENAFILTTKTETWDKFSVDRLMSPQKLSLIEETLKKITDKRLKLKIKNRSELPEFKPEKEENIPVDMPSEEILYENNFEEGSYSTVDAADYDQEMNDEIKRISLKANEGEIKESLKKKALEDEKVKMVLDILGGEITDIEPKI